MNKNDTKKRKQMIYGGQPMVLDTGECEGVRYAIVSYGTHPCAYIENKYFLDVSDGELDYLCPHHDFTFLGPSPFLDGLNAIGWDYAHMGDYMPMYEALGFPDALKKWSTMEVYADVVRCIDRIERLVTGREFYI